VATISTIFLGINSPNFRVLTQLRAGCCCGSESNCGLATTLGARTHLLAERSGEEEEKAEAIVVITAKLSAVGGAAAPDGAFYEMIRCSAACISACSARRMPACHSAPSRPARHNVVTRRSPAAKMPQLLLGKYLLRDCRTCLLACLRISPARPVYLHLLRLRVPTVQAKVQALDLQGQVPEPWRSKFDLAKLT